MKIAVSACLLGHNCKYNGGNNLNRNVLDYIEGHEVFPICPEIAGGLPTPRVPVELKDGKAMNKDGEDVTRYFCRGVELTMKKIREEGISLVILQPRSPSCGSIEIYDGTFTKTLISGKGMFAQALSDAGIPILDGDNISEG